MTEKKTKADLEKELSALKFTKKSAEKKAKTKELKEAIANYDDAPIVEEKKEETPPVKKEEVFAPPAPIVNITNIVKAEETKKEKPTEKADEEEEVRDISNIDPDAIVKAEMKKNGKKKYQMIYQTPQNKKIPLNFNHGKTEHVRRGDTLFLTKDEYLCHAQWLMEVTE